MATLLNLGFLMVTQENGGYLGGYLVTNSLGRPLEFRLSSAVQPNRVQQVLYAHTLVPYICGDLIGKALIEKAAVPVQLVVTTCEAAMDLRFKVEMPVAYLAPPEDSRATFALPKNQGGLIFHRSKPEDEGKTREVLEQCCGLDLTEPFVRIVQALGEARKMGVTTGRSAA